MKIKFVQRIDFYFLLFFTLLTFLVSHNPFFWDTTQLGSRHAIFYLENHLKLQFLPDEIDSGHIPAFGYLLAFVWKIFGKNLPAAHFMMLPFLLGIVFQARVLIQRFFSPQNTLYVMLVFFLDPTLLAQSTLISPDIPLLFFFLLLLNAILSKNERMKLISVLGLSLVSMRGWMVALLLFFFDIGLYFSQTGWRKLNIKDLKILLPYFPGGLIALSYLVLHYLAKGWIGYHPMSPWAPCFEKVSLFGFFRNIFILIWRLVDFGRIILWIAVLLSVKQMIRLKGSDQKLNILYFLVALFILVFPFSMLLHKNLLGNRYLLPAIMLFSILACYLIFEKGNHSKWRKNFILAVIACSLLAGNLIIYPLGIAQGWDSSLAYLPYFQTRNKMIGYMKENHIKLSETGTDFPLKADLQYTDLITTTDKFTTKNFTENRYFLFSNMINDLSDKEIETLQKQWEKVLSHSYLGIHIVLYRNPKFVHYKQINNSILNE